MSEMKVSIAISLLDKATAPLQKLSGRLFGASRAAKAASGSMSGIGKASANIDKCAAAIGKAGNSTDKWAGATNGLAEELGNANKAAKGLEDIANKIDKAADSTEKARKGFRGLIGDADRLSKLKADSGSLMRFGAGMGAAGAGMLGGVALLGKQGMDRQAAMAQLRRGLMQADGTNLLDSVAGTAKSLRGVKGSLDLAEMAAGMFSAGASADSINKGGLEAARDLAIMGNLGNGAAGAQLAALASNSGVADYGALKEIVVRAADGSGLGIEKAMAALGGLASQGGNLGISGEGAMGEFSRMMVAYAAAGVGDGESVISGMLSRLPDLGEKFKHGSGWKSERAGRLMSEAGLDNLTGTLFDEGGQLKGETGEEKLGNINKLIHSINASGLGEQGKMTLLSDLFGRDLAGGLAKFDLGLMNEANEKLLAQASSQEKLALVTENSAARWQALKVSMGDAMAGAGEAILPMAESIIGKLAGIVEGITNWTEGHPKLSGAILTVVGALGGLLAVGGGGITMLGMLGQSVHMAATAFPLLSPALGLLKGGLLAAIGPLWGFTAALLACPITWVVAAIAGAAFLIYKFWGPIKDFFAGVWDTFMGAGPVFDALMLFIMPVIGVPLLIIKHWGAIKGFFKATWGWLVGLWNQIPGWMQWFFPLIKIPLTIIEHWDRIKGFFKATWGWLVGMWNQIPGWMQWFMPIIKIPQTIIENWGKVKDFFGKMGSWLKFGKGKTEAIEEIADAAKTPQPSVPETKKLPGAAKAAKASAGVDMGAAAEQPQKAQKQAKAAKGGGVSITIHYEPKFEFRGDVKDSDKNWFKKQLDEHKEHMAKLVSECFEEQGRWAT